VLWEQLVPGEGLSPTAERVVEVVREALLTVTEVGRKNCGRQPERRFEEVGEYVYFLEYVKRMLGDWAKGITVVRNL
jgi:hypothetical protein